ncbi:hypothetical protein E0765_05720 [Sulfuricurvum sp. IAE1]|jgi:hypothetical protein|uniref:hypothetical protein n=1 Tax=Sulfuricurvum sp. IAE1 TaxID=2546102 RepID=UPI0010493724|nr:hypothetical protein [Sulfuricurvum sp. IAE1]MDD3770863.1 hypothetical protein [Sulfuricurvum sp.]MDX9967262.1 hypothetical protein [Sulfuricurvum sp.]TDA64209.1 hypothetical protein E0765_05720 [Sulfuricurvum sp. IAE1]
MRKKTARDLIIDRYTPTTVKIESRPFTPQSVGRGATLEEFYREVDAKNAQSFRQQYLVKDASEIESMMRHNRKLIDAKRGRGN